MNIDNQRVIYCEHGEYKTWIHTIVWEFILEFTFNYMSSYTIIEIMWYVQLFESLYMGILPLIRVEILQFLW